MTQQPAASPRFSIKTLGLLLLPLLLLGGVIAIFLNTGGGLNLKSPIPIEGLTIERYILKHDLIEVYVLNSSPQEITLAQAIINSAVWPIEVSPSATIPRLGRAVVHIDYPWSYGEA
jgi:hypothetical protein